MQPHEIKPDTQLCTILGYNAQTGYTRRYFNAILKENGTNATAIALNIKDEHLDVTLSSVGNSKVERMIVEAEFQKEAMHYCHLLNETAQQKQRIDLIEVHEEKLHGYCLDDEAKALFCESSFLDAQILFVAKMMLIAHRWYGAKIDTNMIPLLIQKMKG